MQTPLRILPVALVLLASFSSPSVVGTALADDASAQRLQALEVKVRALEARLRSLEARVGKAPAGSTDEAQAKALDLLRRARKEVSEGRIEQAKKTLAEIESKYPSTKSGAQARLFAREVAVLGQPAGDLAVEKWYQGDASMDEGLVTILVFWEAWCPHCKREVPQLEALYQKYKDRGLNLIALTRVTRSSTDAKVEAFIADHGLTYPVAKEEMGKMATRFAVNAVPTAVAIKSGEVVWRGQPSGLTDALLEQWLSQPAQDAAPARSARRGAQAP